MAAGENWTWEETQAAFALYFLIPPGKQTKTHEDVIALANSLGRTPSSVGLKLANLKANDPNRTGKGLVNGSKLDSLIWEYYEADGDGFLGSSLDILCSRIESQTRHSELLGEISTEIHYRGTEGYNRIITTTQRVGQEYFRNALLDNYNHRCCLTGLKTETLLMASHIKPWKDSDSHEKVMPSNGLLLNALHDRAFDKGLITINTKNDRMIVVVSSKVKKDGIENEWLWSFSGHEIELPKRALPDLQFIKFHNDEVFLG